jgi:arabinose-5-phosphate isomerase
MPTMRESAKPHANLESRDAKSAPRKASCRHGNAMTAIDASRARQLARETLEIEAQALHRVRDSLDDAFDRSVQCLLDCRGRVVVMGMGKSGHVGRKIAATLASTGTPALFVHPGEASHGDLGMVTTGDVVIAISNSGESNELDVVLPVVKRLGVTIVSITGNPKSSLARHADHVISSAVDREACPLSLAPTASTTAQMALGDALAVALLDARGFGAEDFARSHPGGALGRRVLAHVGDLMRRDDAVPRVRLDATGAQLLEQMSAKKIGCTAIVDDDGRPVGIFTDGDLRRAVERGTDMRSGVARALMTRNPKTIGEQRLAAEAAAVMEQAKVTSVLVVDAQGLLVGALTSNDLLRAKVI